MGRPEHTHHDDLPQMHTNMNSLDGYERLEEVYDHTVVCFAHLSVAPTQQKSVKQIDLKHTREKRTAVSTAILELQRSHDVSVLPRRHPIIGVFPRSVRLFFISLCIYYFVYFTD